MIIMSELVVLAELLPMVDYRAIAGKTRLLNTAPLQGTDA
jgi:hypothetical protein